MAIALPKSISLTCAKLSERSRHACASAYREVFVDYEIFILDVPMNDAGLMQIFDSVNDLSEDMTGLFLAQLFVFGLLYTLK